MDEVGSSGQILPDESPDPAGLAVHHLVVGSAGVVSGGGDVIEAPGANGLLETEVLAAVSRTGHHRSVADLAKQDEPLPPGQVPRPRPNDLPHLHQSQKTLYSNGIKPLSPSLESSNQQGDSGSSFPVAKRKRAPNGVW